ncbi:MAG: efflux transporter outer membrane subunit [Phycisphaerales bacterium]|nr:efflux transporter outer membrane subunit [Phycisphaerales bacterium]
MNGLRCSSTRHWRTFPPRAPQDSARAAMGWVALTMLVGFSGCEVGPEYAEPGAEVNGGWLGGSGGGAEGVVDEGGVNERWWEGFNDAGLTALVGMAYRENLTLRSAGLRVIEARARRGIAVGRFFPQLQEAVGGVDASRVSANSVQGASGGDRSYAEATIGLQAAWELDFWGKFRRGIEAADAELLATVADYDAVLVTLAADVATNYILVRSLEERLEVTRANVRLQGETLALTQARFRAGAVSELDVATARATLANTQALIPDLENALQQTRLAICTLLARTPSSLEAELAPAPGAGAGAGAGAGGGRVPEAPPRIAAGVPAELLRRRPDVRAAERIAAAQSALIGVAAADLYPSISITGATAFVSSTYDGQRTPGLGDLLDADSFAGFIGLRVNWPVLNYGRIRGNIRVQDARFEQAVAFYRQSVLRAASDVEAGLSDFLRSRERAAYLAEAVNASQRSVDLSLIQYRAGAVDFIRVNNAQTELVLQQDNLIVSRASIALGAVRTYRALGGGWEMRGDAEFVDPQTAERMRRRTDWGDVLAPDWPEGKDLGFPRPPTPAPGTTPTPTPGTAPIPAPGTAPGTAPDPGTLPPPEPRP